MQTPHGRVTWPEILVQAGLLVVCLAFIFPGTFFSGEMIAPGDILYEIYPWRAYKTIEIAEEGSDRLTLDAITAMDAGYARVQRVLQEGEWPLWNHLQLGGMPLMANCQSAVFYPPRLLHAFLDLFVATTLYILLKLWLCGMTAYLCARYMNPGVSVARFASLAWMLAGYNLLWCYWPLPDVSVWAPILLLGVELILDDAHKRGFFMLAGGASMILLAGHPETAFVHGLGVGTYFLLRLGWERRKGRQLWVPLGVAGAAWGVALLVCAVQLIPFLEYLVNSYSFSQRASRSGDRQAALPMSNLVALWVARFFGTWVENNFWGKWNSNLTGMVYPGIAVWLTMSLLPARGSRTPRIRARILCLLTSAIILFLTASSTWPFHLVNSMPPFSTMYVCYHIVWALLAVVMLSATGLEHWLSCPRRPRELGWVAPLIAAATLITAVVYWFNHEILSAMHVVDYVQWQILIAILFVLAGLGVLLVSCFMPRPTLIASILSMLLTIDLIAASRGTLVTSPREELFIETKLTDYLLNLRKPCRIEPSTALIPGGILPIYGVEQWTAYDGLYPERVTHFQYELETDVWYAMEPACAVNYYLHDVRIPSPLFPRDKRGGFKLAAFLDSIEVYENTAAYPRAFLVGKARVVPEFTEMFNIMRRKDFNPREEVLLEAAPADPLPSAEGPSQGLGEARVTEQASTRTVVHATAGEPCILVLADGFYPGWKAFIDGRRAELFPVYYAFRGVILPAGSHVVEYRYEPLSFYVGLAISSLTLAAGSIFGVGLLWRRSRGAIQLSRAHPAPPA